jgi:hypothetical protein
MLVFDYIDHRWKRLQMWKVIVDIILCLCLSALLRLESKLIVAACRDTSVIRGISEFVHCRTLASRHAATISFDSSLKRADRHKHKMMTPITFHICNLFHLWSCDLLLNGSWGMLMLMKALAVLHKSWTIVLLFIKGTVQWKLTGVLSGINRKLMICHCSDGYSFFNLKGLRSLKSKNVFSALTGTLF